MDQNHKAFENVHQDGQANDGLQYGQEQYNQMS